MVVNKCKTILQPNKDNAFGSSLKVTKSENLDSKAFVHSSNHIFMHSFNKYFLNSYYMQVTVMEVRSLQHATCSSFFNKQQIQKWPMLSKNLSVNYCIKREQNRKGTHYTR